MQAYLSLARGGPPHPGAGGAGGGQGSKERQSVLGTFGGAEMVGQ